jgi:hypothetical protein
MASRGAIFGFHSNLDLTPRQKIFQLTFKVAFACSSDEREVPVVNRMWMICLDVYTTLLYLISASGSELANTIVNDPKMKRSDGIAGLLQKYRPKICGR